MPDAVCRFAEALRQLLHARTAATLERSWTSADLDGLGWEALGRARRQDVRRWEPVLDEVDGLLLRLLDRVPVFAAGPSAAAGHVRTFRLPELERLQHATAAALVAQRFGAAGLRTVVADQDAPLARRYFAFLALAERHPPPEWPLFARYLNPDAHHAFVGTAAEAARFYPDVGAGARLVGLFEAVRSDLHLREFLSPRILESLYVLSERQTLPFFRELLTAGHTHPVAEHCEVTRALVMVRRFTGSLEPNSKYRDLFAPAVHVAIDRAEAAFQREREVLTPVAVI
ncbi:MAG: hypothetical protein GTN78_20695 [Gemmatimonadales bacterium]|nr:hypothetical protein [Gemmatimonadales bacterium]NIN10102.1 hypothetical protein [Gemmatimonadales bacterium]NIR02586.1 hypothetical protein [Gemmatimonadales bacterium]NIS66280.1 hypothetical protein [Gemmatimonadales bacterium]